MISGTLVTLWGPDVVFDTGSCHPARRVDAAVRANGPRAWWRAPEGTQEEMGPTTPPVEDSSQCPSVAGPGQKVLFSVSGGQEY